MLKTSKVALLAAMLSFSILPAASLPALAQDLALTTEEPSGPPFTFNYEVPNIILDGSSMSETALREVFNGKVLEHADELGALNAKSITIPEITIEYSVGVPGAGDMKTSYVARDLVFSDIVNGVVGKTTLRELVTKSSAGAEVTSGTNGELNISGLDLGATLRFLGILKGDPAAGLVPLYTGYTSGAGDIGSPAFTCDIGDGESRPLLGKASTIAFTDVRDAVLALMAMEDPGDAVPPEAVTLITYAFDLFRGVSGGGGTIGAVACEAEADGMKVAIGLGGAETGDFAPGIYPNIAINGLAVDAGEMGTFALGQFALKPIDFNGMMDNLQAALGQGKLDDAWLEENARLLIPSFDGFSFGGLALDMINPDAPSGPRLTASIGDFDLSLGNYLNGIPTVVSSSASGVDIPLPEDASDPQLAMLRAVGIERISAGYDLALAWNADANAIDVSKVALSMADLANVSVSAEIGNATAQLFDLDPEMIENAAMGLTVKNLTLTYTDEGIGEIAWPILAQQQGAPDVGAFRTQMAGFAEGFALQLLGSTDAARQLGLALSEYVTGAKQTVTITLKAKDEAGVPLMAFMAAQNDPTALLALVDITGSAQ